MKNINVTKLNPCGMGNLLKSGGRGGGFKPSVGKSSYMCTLQTLTTTFTNLIIEPNKIITVHVC